MANPVSQAFKDAMKAPTKMLRASITTNESTPRVITSADNLVSVLIESNGRLFGTGIDAATIKLIGTDYNLIGVGINIQFGVRTSFEAEAWEACDRGMFSVMEQTVDLEKGMTTLKCFNVVGTMAEEPYSAGEILFPCTVAEMAQQIADRFGITLGTDMRTLPNSDYVITEDLYANISSITYRDILAEIAGATATLAAIRSENNALYFLPAPTASETWTYDNLLKIKLDPKYGPVNSVVLARTPQEDNIVVTDDISIEENGLTEIKLANNEILDDSRQELAQPILDAVNGYGFYPFEATTEGHGWYECGDRVIVANGTEEWEVTITDIRLEISQGIKEVLKGVAPTQEQTDYARAGGIMKTIYNTEIKVDKQGQQIESVVSRQDEFEGETQDNFTTVIQNITNVITSVQSSGGANLIRNSVGYFLDDQNMPLNWTVDLTGGSISIAPSSEAITHGSASGNVIALAGGKISQRIAVVADTGAEDSPRYSFSVRVKKGAVGTGRIQLTDGIETYILDFATGDNPYYDQFTIQNILPKNNYLDLTVLGSSDSDFAVTDMMLAIGDYVSQWTQANGEFANTQVNIDIDGVTVASSTVQGSRTLQTPFQFAGYQNGVLTYSLDATAVKSDKAILKSGIEMPPLKIVTMANGWAWVPMESPYVPPPEQVEILSVVQDKIEGKTTVVATFSLPVNTPSGWTASNNNTTLTRMFTENTNVNITVTAHNTSTVQLQVIVEVIPLTQLTISISQSQVVGTTTVTATCNIPVIAPSGWSISGDKKILTKTFTSNTSLNITVVAENTTTAQLQAEVEVIPTPQLEVVDIQQTQIVGKTTVSALFNLTVIAPTGWTLSSDKKTITRAYTSNASIDITVTAENGTTAQLRANVVVVTALVADAPVYTQSIGSTLVEVTFNKPVVAPSGWTISGNALTISRTYTSDYSGNVNVSARDDISTTTVAIAVEVIPEPTPSGIEYLDGVSVESATNTLTCAEPDTQVGDVLIAILGNGSASNATYTAPDGYELILQSTGGPTYYGDIRVYARVVTEATSGRTNNWVSSVVPANGHRMTTMAFRGVDAATPISVFDYATEIDTGVTTFVAPSITTTVPSYILAGYSFRVASATWTDTPAGYEVLWNGVGAQRPQCLAVGAMQDTAGATGDLSATANKAYRGSTFTLALNPKGRSN